MTAITGHSAGGTYLSTFRVDRPSPAAAPTQKHPDEPRARAGLSSGPDRARGADLGSSDCAADDAREVLVRGRGEVLCPRRDVRCVPAGCGQERVHRPRADRSRLRADGGIGDQRRADPAHDAAARAARRCGGPRPARDGRALSRTVRGLPDRHAEALRHRRGDPHQGTDLRGTSRTTVLSVGARRYATTRRSISGRMASSDSAPMRS